MKRIAGWLFILLAAGCTVMQPAPQEALSPPEAEALSTPAKSAAPAVTTPAPSTTVAATPAAKTPVPATPAARKPEAPPAAGAKPASAAAAKPMAPPPLDLKTLEQQLKETKAIGVMTKLSIKNQVDDLLEQFRAYYQGKIKTSLADLRRSYDLLVMKVLTLLQDGDQALARAVASSREAIWGVLANPKEFAKI